MRTKSEVEIAFTSQKLNIVQSHKIMKLTDRFKEMATDIIDLCPESADRTAAIRKLLEVKHMSVHSISHEPQKPEIAKAPPEKKQEVKQETKQEVKQ